MSPAWGSLVHTNIVTVLDQNTKGSHQKNFGRGVSGSTKLFIEFRYGHVIGGVGIVDEVIQVIEINEANLLQNK